MSNTPATPDDDALAEFLADRVIAEVAAKWPDANWVFRRQAARLMLGQLTGRIKQPGDITLSDLAKAFRIPQQRFSEEYARTEMRAKAAYLKKYLTPPEF